MIQRAQRKSPSTCARLRLAGRWRDAAARRLSWKVPTPERPQLRGGRARRGRTAKWSSRAVRSAARSSPSPPDGRRRAKRRGAPESEREGPATNRRLHVNKIAARRAGGPTGSSRRRREQEVPRASLRSPHVPRPGSDSETPVWRRQGWGSTLHAPPTFTLPEGRARGPETLDPQPEGASAGRTWHQPRLPLAPPGGRRGGRHETGDLRSARQPQKWLVAAGRGCPLPPRLFPGSGGGGGRGGPSARSRPLAPPLPAARSGRGPPTAQPPPRGLLALTSSPPHQPQGRAEREGAGWGGATETCGRGDWRPSARPALVRRGLGSRIFYEG